MDLSSLEIMRAVAAHRHGGCEGARTSAVERDQPRAAARTRSPRDAFPPRTQEGDAYSGADDVPVIREQPACFGSRCLPRHKAIPPQGSHSYRHPGYSNGAGRRGVIPRFVVELVHRPSVIKTYCLGPVDALLIRRRNTRSPEFDPFRDALTVSAEADRIPA